MSKGKKILLSLLIILCLALICLGVYMVLLEDKKGNNDVSQNNNKNNSCNYDICIYENEYGTRLAATAKTLQLESYKKYKIVDGITFSNNDAVYNLHEYNNYYDDYVLYYDKDLVLCEIASFDKKVINVNYEKYFTKEDFKSIQWSVNKKENGDIIGVALSLAELGPDDRLIKKGFYYNFETGKTILENEYTVISSTNNSNYLQLSLTWGGQADYFHKIFDIKNNKIIFSVDDNGFVDLNVYNQDGKRYILTYDLYGSNLKVFDEKVNIVNDVSFPYMEGDEICVEPGDALHFSDYNKENGNYVLPKNGKILTYDLLGNLISSSDKYDDLYNLTYDYSLVKKNENITLVKNDGSFEYNLGKIESFYIKDDEMSDNCVRTSIQELEKNIIDIRISGKNFIFNTRTSELSKIESNE